MNEEIKEDIKEEIKEEIKEDIIEDDIKEVENTSDSTADDSNVEDRVDENVEELALKKKDEEISELKDKLIRQLAEFDNYRKRTDAEKSRMYDFGARDVAEKMLVVVDNIERALKDVKSDEEDPFKQGIIKIHEQLMDVLKDLNISPIDAVNNSFDPELHNAVMHVEDESFGENEVIEEFLKGYMYKDTVLRHSMVKVAN